VSKLLGKTAAGTGFSWVGFFLFLFWVCAIEPFKISAYSWSKYEI
jgi:hypothetical protein